MTRSIVKFANQHWDDRLRTAFLFGRTCFTSDDHFWSPILSCMHPISTNLFACQLFGCQNTIVRGKELKLALNPSILPLLDIEEVGQPEPPHRSVMTLTSHPTVVRIEPGFCTPVRLASASLMLGWEAYSDPSSANSAAAKSHGGGGRPEPPRRAVETHRNWQKIPNQLTKVSFMSLMNLRSELCMTSQVTLFRS